MIAFQADRFFFGSQHSRPKQPPLAEFQSYEAQLKPPAGQPLASQREGTVTNYRFAHNGTRPSQLTVSLAHHLAARSNDDLLTLARPLPPTYLAIYLSIYPTLRRPVQLSDSWAGESIGNVRICFANLPLKPTCVTYAG